MAVCLDVVKSKTTMALTARPSDRSVESSTRDGEGQQPTGLTDEKWLFGSEVFQRVLVTVAVVCLARLGSFVVAPGFDFHALTYTSYSDFGGYCVLCFALACLWQDSHACHVPQLHMQPL